MHIHLIGVDRLNDSSVNVKYTFKINFIFAIFNAIAENNIGSNGIRKKNSFWINILIFFFFHNFVFFPRYSPIENCPVCCICWFFFSRFVFLVVIASHTSGHFDSMHSMNFTIIIFYYYNSCNLIHLCRHFWIIFVFCVLYECKL